MILLDLLTDNIILPRWFDIRSTCGTAYLTLSYLIGNVRATVLVFAASVCVILTGGIGLGNLRHPVMSHLVTHLTDYVAKICILRGHLRACTRRIWWACIAKFV